MFLILIEIQRSIDGENGGKNEREGEREEDIDRIGGKRERERERGGREREIKEGRE